MTVDLPKRRAELLALRERLITTAHDLVVGDALADHAPAAADLHMADHASDMVDRELDGSLESNATAIVREIDDALERIDASTYGACVRCGGRIPEERLDAVPYATLCVACKRDEERLERAGA